MSSLKLTIGKESNRIPPTCLELWHAEIAWTILVKILSRREQNGQWKFARAEAVLKWSSSEDCSSFVPPKSVEKLQHSFCIRFLFIESPTSRQSKSYEEIVELFDTLAGI